MELTYLEAISDALRVALREDDRVLLLGEDVGAFGGAFKVTAGLQQEFGPDRVVDTPISEEAMIGGAVGAAIVGMRPVCEMQFADFVACGFDQLVNVAGKLHWRLGLARASCTGAWAWRRRSSCACPAAAASPAARSTPRTRRPGSCTPRA
ncbi:MAG: hypothetical protein ABR947_01515 [Solirubrobacteraceae bacterium]